MTRLTVARLAVLVIAIGPHQVGAQAHAGAIVGTVSDSSRRPLAEADVVLYPVGRRARTDSLGRFAFEQLKNGGYVIRTRKLGYEADSHDVALSDNGRMSVKFVLRRRVELDTVRVTARADCPLFTMDGFFCRQRHGGGVFLDYPDIDQHARTFTGDLFTSVRGFGMTLRPTLGGTLMPVPRRLGNHCLMYLVNGHIVEDWSFVPRYTKAIMAIEAYIRPDSVPANIQHEMRFHSSMPSSRQVKRCDAVVFWTIDAPMDSKRNERRYSAIATP